VGLLSHQNSDVDVQEQQQQNRMMKKGLVMSCDGSSESNDGAEGSDAAISTAVEAFKTSSISSSFSQISHCAFMSIFGYATWAFRDIIFDETFSL
jgi:hypothetical protein